MSENQDQIQTVGRRKTSVARVMLRPGKGEWRVNGRTMADYFPRPTHQIRIEEPLKLTELDGQFDVTIRVHGGGLTGQSDAVRMGLARAIVVHDEELRPVLRGKGMLTRDARQVERKKPGRPKARKRFQFSKR
ncbi:MAG: 30S ribosomal protein S9 [Gemmatimonadales bacterium]|jgi:small subunit ribosomal protein S9|nr:30S ribosomal protein S9 [Gemmatimonadales bacterium]MDG2240819.1 30S ribosomal protein S9 [Longimicrobiales bacterium]NCG32203.1 30S ribosomal protein S9 [Pseudomonadota bacterium]MBT3498921.1 30S ribosomal protein S9 [Gemmatimonadales bacterium]MBT3957297.1 30S ribosomal protein S9 [Gemmatimonadales bacterium]